ncbi:MAG: ABC transporter permease, partial [Spirochaetia bacterium]
MSIGWPFYVAKRYVNAGRGKNKVTPARLSVGGIAVGVTALVTVIGVMNGFQLSFIENILSIHSFHIRIYADPGDTDIEGIKDLEQVESVLPFRETQSLIQGGVGDYRSCVIRGVPSDLEEIDPDLVQRLNVIRGNLDLRGGTGIVLGGELANRLGVQVGDLINIVALSGDSFSSLKPSDVEFRVRGIFRSGYYEFDAGFAFIRKEEIESIASKGTENIIGVKLKDRFRDAETAEKIEPFLPEGYAMESWREYNRAFFGALRMEKLAMMLLIGLIFVVVG